MTERHVKLTVVDGGASLTDWLTAIGGMGAFLAAAVLAVFGHRQMKATQRQSDASLVQAEVTREGVAKQTYPLVYAHQRKAMSWDQEEDAFAFRYYLSNEGLGPALNVEHGVLIGDTEFVFGYEQPLPFKSLQPGELAPPLDSSMPDPVPPTSLERFVQRDDLYRTGEAGVSHPLAEAVYFCRYESLFGERWETRTSSLPSKKPDVRRLPGNPEPEQRSE